MAQFRLGASVHFGPTLTYTLMQQTPCLQFCLPQKAKVSVSDLGLARQYCEKEKVSFYLHCPLNANLATCEGHKCIQHQTVVQKELNVIQGLPGACVLHIGKTGGMD